MTKRKNEPCVMMRKSTLECLQVLPAEDKSTIICHFIDAVINEDYEEQGKHLASINTALIGYFKMLVDFHVECTENYKSKCEKMSENIKKRYNGIQLNTTENDCTQLNTKYKGKDKGKCKDIEKESEREKPLSHAHEDFTSLLAHYTSSAHQLWQENLMRTYSLNTEQLKDCITDGINYCLNTGKAITEGNIKRYTLVACKKFEHLAPMAERDEAFKQECIALKDGRNNDLVTEFYYYYRQPSRKGSDKMLFEMQVGWDTQTMFIRYLKRNGKL